MSYHKKNTTNSSTQPQNQLTVAAAYLQAVDHFNIKQYEAADQLCTAIIKAQPNHIDAINLLGVVAQQINRHDLAVEQFSSAIKIADDTELLHYNLGLSLLQLGQIQKGIASLQRAIAIQPAYYEALNSLGYALYGEDRLDEAVKYLQKAISIKPDYLIAYNNLGNVYLAKGEFDKAVDFYQKSLLINSDYSEAHNNLGNALLAQGKLEDAKSSYKKAISINPVYLEAYNNLGNVYKEQGDLLDAVKCLQKAIAIDPQFVQGYFNLANIMGEQGKLDDAVENYRKAIEIKPDFVEAYGNLGNILNDQGKFEEATQYYLQAIKIDPYNINAHVNIAGIKRYSSIAEVDSLKTLLAKSTTAKEISLLNFAIAKGMFDLQQQSDGIKYYLEGNRVHRGTFEFAIAETKKTFEKFINLFDKDFIDVKKGIGVADATPIFILGMPRSGSTLIEQILSSHPDVHGAGELPYLEEALLQNSAAKTVDEIPEMVTALNVDDAKNIADKYIEYIRNIDSKTKYITDKMPGNFVYIGIIRMLLPHAKIIHSVRCAEDTCFSIFRENFKQFHPYAYDLTELGQYYRLYTKMMAHWHALFPGAIYDIHYENLTLNQEDETKKLLKYCGLPWDDNCLKFYKTSRNVRTASNYQVRQPMYTSSINGWKPFKKQLKPLIDALGDLASDF
ncbi:MAG: tetratricopeptide repeat protein [Magnetococcales bacterium]|nr:tetratricopeptide repeat protein [Magnetococcales bacterium]